MISNALNIADSILAFEQSPSASKLRHARSVLGMQAAQAPGIINPDLVKDSQRAYLAHRELRRMARILAKHVKELARRESANEPSVSERELADLRADNAKLIKFVRDMGSTTVAAVRVLDAFEDLTCEVSDALVKGRERLAVARLSIPEVADPESSSGTNTEDPEKIAEVVLHEMQIELRCGAV